MSEVSQRRMRMHALAAATALVLSSVVAAPAVSAPRLNLAGLTTAEYEGFIVQYHNPGLVKSSKATMQRSLDSVARRSGTRGLSLNHSRTLAMGAELIQPNRKLDRVQTMMLMNAFAQDSNVKLVELNLVVHAAKASGKVAATLLKPNDPSYSQQWGFSNAKAGINVEGVWDKHQGEGVVVAIVDTGITPHSDLKANLIGGYDFISSSSTAGDGDGRDKDPLDNGGQSGYHGTHVSGTVAAVTNNGKGVAGTAPKAKILAARVLGVNGSGTFADVMDGMMWSAGLDVSGVPKNTTPAEVINMSLGAESSSCESAMQQTIDKVTAAGTTIVVAAGNSNGDVSQQTPANCKSVIAVGSVTSTGARSSFSTYGAGVDVGAPGSTIYSTHWNASGESYSNMNGTSMASPHVAGIAALVQGAVDKPLTPAQVKQAIRDGARKYSSPLDKPLGTGYADAAGAIAAACKIVTCNGGGGGGEAPKASFEYKADGLEVNFNDTSTDDGKLVKWEWKFGDDTSSSDASPVHKYKADGSYKVVLTVTDDTGKTGTSEQTVKVGGGGGGGAPKAAFEYKADGLEVNFNDTSTDDGKIVKWDWKFGDGATSSDASPLHKYKSGGNYTVVLTVTDDSGKTGTAEQKVSVDGGGGDGAPKAAFEYKADGLEVNFNDLSTDDGKLVKWEWKFGDGGTSTQASPLHKYKEGGNYTVVLTVTDDSGKTGTAEQKVNIVSGGGGGAPKAAFEYKADGREVNFNDTSTDDGKIVAWMWDFGDGTTSKDASPVHAYKKDGSFTVVLTVTDDDGNTGKAEQKISVGGGGGLPKADFEFKADGLEVNFNDQSSDPDGKIVAWSWSFGDGTSSTGSSPIHKYAKAGNYTVVLKVTDDSGNSATVEKKVSVGTADNQPPKASFEYKADRLEVNFNDTSTDSDGKIVAWSWDFGDGDTSKGQSPVKKYAKSGTYTVRLTVTDDAGATATTDQKVVVQGDGGDNKPPKAAFEYKADGAEVNFNDMSTDSDGKIVAWSWSFGDGASSKDPSPVHTYTTGGTYNVVLTVTDDSGNTGTAEQKVTIDGGADKEPDAGFGFKITGLQVAFTDVSTDDGKIVEWEWDFGDDSASKQQNPTHTYAKGGIYTVSLTVRDDAGNKGSAEHKVEVKGDVPSDGKLENGKTLKVGGGIDSRQYFSIEVPAGANKLNFATMGGTGDVDMYVKFGAKPTMESYDCRPYMKGNVESCAMPEAKAGTWWVMLDGYRSFSDVSLTASFAAASETVNYGNSNVFMIEDNKTVDSEVVVTKRDGKKGLKETRVGVAIVHTHIGDLRVSLVSASGKEYVLHNRSGGSADNIFNTFTVDLSAEDLNGSWKLRVNDNGNGDTGSLMGWNIQF